MMLLGIFENTNGQIEKNLYYKWECWHRATFSPATKILKTILFQVKGKNYNERKENLRQIAIEYQNTDKSGLSWGEYSEIEDFLLINGKRYGLLREFIENGII